MAYMLKKASLQSLFNSYAEMLSFITTLSGDVSFSEDGSSLSVLQIFRNGHDTELVVADERDDVVAFGTRVYVGLNALESIENRSAGLIDVTVALGDVINALFAYALHSQDGSVDTEIGCRVVSHDAEGRHIAGDAASALYKHPVADARVLVDHHAR